MPWYPRLDHGHRVRRHESRREARRDVGPEPFTYHTVFQNHLFELDVRCERRRGHENGVVHRTVSNVVETPETENKGAK